MRYFKILIASFSLFTLASCASVDCKPNKGSVLQGTDTAVVALYIDKKGYPQAQVDTVTVHPGQKIIFVGPDKFDILFKDQKSPIGRLEVPSSNSILTIEIPKDIFERDQRETKTTETKKELKYRYGIRVNGKVTDPIIIISRG